MTAPAVVSTAWRSLHERSRVPGQSSFRIGLLVVGVAVFIVFSLRHERFATSDNLLNIALTNSAVLVAATGAMLLLLAGQVDISIGSIFALSSVVSAEVAVRTGNVFAGVAASLVCGALLGAVNGIVVRLLPISPIIVTLATFGLYRGLAYLVTDGRSISGLPDAYIELGRGGVGALSWPVVVSLVIFVLAAIWVTRTRTGLRIYAVGGDARAAVLSGVAVGRITIGLFVVNGLLVGLISMLTTARLGIANPVVGTGFEFDVLTAAILGGIAFAGGGGRPLGILIGVATLGVINAGLVYEGLPDYWQQITKGALLLVALAADQLAVINRRRRLRNATIVSPSPAKIARNEEAARSSPLTGPNSATVSRAEGNGDSAPTPCLEANGLSKRYDAVIALDNVTLSVRPGEVLCLVGDNGAGKSTLIKILSGAVQPDSGTITLNGRTLALNSPHASLQAGIRTVYQDLALCPNLSVAHNFVLGAEPIRRIAGVPIRDDRAAEDRSERYLTELGIRLPNQRVIVGALSGGQRQTLAVARAIEGEFSVAIFDEPTAALGVTQTSNVLGLIRTVARRGAAVILITHDVHTVLGVADRLAVLRLGRVVRTGAASEFTELELLRLMSGIGPEADASMAPAASNA